MESLSFDYLAAQFGLFLTLAYQYVSQPVTLLLLIAAFLLGWLLISPKR
jgi:hypothetical protein